MGNALRFLCGECLKPFFPSSTPQPLGPHGVTTATVGVSALAHDILHFDVTSEVPDGLGNYVVSSKRAQANWYRKLSVAWKEAKPPPRSPEDVAVLVIRTLKNHQRADVQGLLEFYALPHLESIGDAPDGATSSALPVNVKFAFDTLPVDVKSVADGDTVTVYVDTTEARESSLGVPMEVLQAKMRRSEARAVRDYKTADALQKEIVNAGFRVLPGPDNEDILARKYRIRLRGIDAPENSQPYGKESKEALAKLVVGKCLRILIYEEDRYGRSVGDIYCNGIFVQEMMLKKGHAWHYVAYDKRPEFAMWEKSARAARRGLWALSNPEKPWDYRRDQCNGALVLENH